jgi:uncharacterized membrane protein
MQTTHQYYYRKGKATTKAVIYIILSVLLVAFAVFSYVHWELSFMFTDWHGYVIIIPYFLITLGIILSVFEEFKKASMTSRGIPAFAVGDDNFVIYDKGLANVILFEDCDKVRFKRTYSRIRGTQLYLIIRYHDKMDVPSTFKVDLSELDRPQSEIDKQLKKIYNNYKKEHNIQ